MNEKIIKCPRCGTECKEKFYIQNGIGVVESNYECEYCGFYENFAYGVTQEVDNLTTYEKILFPCKPGAKVYRIYTRSWIGEDEVKEWIIDKTGIFYINQYNRMTHIGLFGYRVFTDKEKAEECLKHLKEINEVLDDVPFE